MTVTFTAANASVTAQAQDIASSAFTEAGIQNPQEPLDADMLAWGLEKEQRLLDQFNARQELIYTVNFAQYNLQANHFPHTIGPGGDFNVAQRPVKLISCNLVLLSSSPNIDLRMHVRDSDWWSNQRIKSLLSTLPTDVYYEPDNPLGQLNFWPVPTVVNAVRLETWTGLTQAVAPTTLIALPQAYWDAIVLTLAIRLCPSYGREASPTLIAMQKEAMQAILNNNMESPTMDTAGAGIPDRPQKPGFNFLSGQPW